MVVPDQDLHVRLGLFRKKSDREGSDWGAHDRDAMELVDALEMPVHGLERAPMLLSQHRPRPFSGSVFVFKSSLVYRHDCQ
jgi:hypothetical protein